MNKYVIKNADAPISLRISNPNTGEKIHQSAVNFKMLKHYLLQKINQDDFNDESFIVESAKIADSFVVFKPQKTVTLKEFCKNIENYDVEIDVYFAGAVYGTNILNYEFKMVSPGWKNSLPYLTLHKSGLSLCMHHSALYRVSKDGCLATLCTGEDGCSESKMNTAYAPRTVKLSTKHKESILQSIKNKKFYI